jgi:hypothetical protein
LDENPSEQKRRNKANLKTEIVTKHAEQCSNNGRTEGDTEYRKLTKCLEAYNETKRPTYTGICFGENLITSLASLLKMIPS